VLSIEVSKRFKYRNPFELITRDLGANKVDGDKLVTEDFGIEELRRIGIKKDS